MVLQYNFICFNSVSRYVINEVKLIFYWKMLAFRVHVKELKIEILSRKLCQFILLDIKH